MQPDNWFTFYTWPQSPENAKYGTAACSPPEKRDLTARFCAAPAAAEPARLFCFASHRDRGRRQHSQNPSLTTPSPFCSLLPPSPQTRLYFEGTTVHYDQQNVRKKVINMFGNHTGCATTASPLVPTQKEPATRMTRRR